MYPLSEAATNEASAPTKNVRSCSFVSAVKVGRIVEEQMEKFRHHLFIEINCYHSVTPITEGVERRGDKSFDV